MRSGHGRREAVHKGAASPEVIYPPFGQKSKEKHSLESSLALLYIASLQVTGLASIPRPPSERQYETHVPLGSYFPVPECRCSCAGLLPRAGRHHLPLAGEHRDLSWLPCDHHPVGFHICCGTRPLRQRRRCRLRYLCLSFDRQRDELETDQHAVRTALVFATRSTRHPLHDRGTRTARGRCDSQVGRWWCNLDRAVNSGQRPPCPGRQFYRVPLWADAGSSAQWPYLACDGAV